MVETRSRMFGDLARFYDALYGAKDYRAESRSLVRLVRRYARSKGHAWLDVACGTGRHLEFLRREWDVSGVDASPQMLRLARRRLPGVPLVQGDMRRFRLKDRFDVITCLFSAIGHLPSEADLLRTFHNFSTHLKPGGVAIVEPWIDPEDFRPGMVHLVSYRSPSLVIARMAFSARTGNRSAISYRYLIGEARRGVRHEEETDRGLLVPRRRLVELMERSGLRGRFLRHGLPTGRGLLVGRKPIRPPRTAGRPRRPGPAAQPGRPRRRPPRGGRRRHTLS